MFLFAAFFHPSINPYTESPLFSYEKPASFELSLGVPLTNGLYGVYLDFNKPLLSFLDVDVQLFSWTVAFQYEEFSFSPVRFKYMTKECDIGLVAVPKLLGAYASSVGVAVFPAIDLDVIVFKRVYLSFRNLSSDVLSSSNIPNWVTFFAGLGYSSEFSKSLKASLAFYLVEPERIDWTFTSGLPEFRAYLDVAGNVFSNINYYIGLRDAYPYVGLSMSSSNIVVKYFYFMDFLGHRITFQWRF